MTSLVLLFNRECPNACGFGFPKVANVLQILDFVETDVVVDSWNSQNFVLPHISDNWEKFLENCSKFSKIPKAEKIIRNWAKSLKLSKIPKTEKNLEDMAQNRRIGPWYLLKIRNHKPTVRNRILFHDFSESEKSSSIFLTRHLTEFYNFIDFTL